MGKASARRIGLAAALMLAAAMPAVAHHGWSWTVEELSELKGVVREVFVGNPHAALDVDVGGEIWKVELAPPRATEQAGFTEASAKPGDEVTAIGNRSRDQAERRMKAVRIIVNGKTYDVYPSRVPTD
jgi:hypothetical protein